MNETLLGGDPSPSSGTPGSWWLSLTGFLPPSFNSGPRFGLYRLRLFTAVAPDVALAEAIIGSAPTTVIYLATLKNTDIHHPR